MGLKHNIISINVGKIRFTSKNASLLKINNQPIKITDTNTRKMIAPLFLFFQINHEAKIKINVRIDNGIKRMSAKNESISIPTASKLPKPQNRIKRLYRYGAIKFQTIRAKSIPIAVGFYSFIFRMASYFEIIFT